MSPRALPVVALSLGLGSLLAGCNSVFGVDDLTFAGAGGSAVTTTSSSSSGGEGGGGGQGGSSGKGGAPGGGGIGGTGGRVAGSGGMGGGMVVGVCGDGELTPDETCDDNNTDPGDGCSATCQLEEMIADSCPANATITLGADPILIAGSTLGNDNGLSSMCAAPTAPDAILSFQATEAATVTVGLEGAFGKAVSARFMCSAALLGACESNGPNETDPLSTSFPLFAGSTFHVLVTGNAPDQSGDFVLTVTP